MFFGNDGFRGRGSTSSPLNVLFDWPDSSGDSATGGADCTAWVYVQGCVWRPEERAMICSCLAADGERSRKEEEADMGLATDSELCWDWLDASMVWVNGQLLSPASGLLVGEA